MQIEYDAIWYRLRLVWDIDVRHDIDRRGGTRGRECWFVLRRGVLVDSLLTLLLIKLLLH